MKKSAPFGQIPIPSMPTSISGQWLTFSHMASHYRRLLNVKPRVDSGAPKKSASSTSFNFMLKRKPKPKGENKGHPLNTTYTKKDENIAEKELEYYSDNSGGAFLSDPEKESSDDLYYEKSIGIGERIQFYLDQINDSNVTINSRRKPQKPLKNRPCSTTVNISSYEQQRDTKMPARKSSSAYDNPNMYKVQERQEALKRSALSQCTISYENKRNGPSKSSKYFNSIVERGGGDGDRLDILDQKAGNLRSMSKAKLTREDIDNISTLMGRNESPRSLGTIRGSDDLGYSDMKHDSPSSQNQGKNIQEINYSLGQPSRSRLLTVDSSPRPTRQYHNHESRQNVQQNKSPSGVIKNGKESSHDSAYGISSGESKITTRESTPEKSSKHRQLLKSISNKRCKSRENGKFKSSLSTVASSINQDFNQSQSSGRSNWMKEEKYITFVSQVTDDIVKRGIYTNKGLKNLFKTHVDNHPELETDKLTKLLDKLRVDVGVPKEDTLNNLEFGYGSIKYSIEPFFYQKKSSIPENEPQKTTTTTTTTAKSQQKRDRKPPPPLPAPITSLQNDQIIQEMNTTVDEDNYTTSAGSSSTSTDTSNSSLLILENPTKESVQNVVKSPSSPKFNKSTTNTSNKVQENKSTPKIRDQNVNQSSQAYSSESFEDASNSSAESSTTDVSSLNLSETEIKGTLKEIGFKEKTRNELLRILSKSRHKTKS